jgi:hypothetical protein
MSRKKPKKASDAMPPLAAPTLRRGTLTPLQR